MSLPPQSTTERKRLRTALSTARQAGGLLMFLLFISVALLVIAVGQHFWLPPRDVPQGGSTLTIGPFKVPCEDVAELAAARGWPLGENEGLGSITCRDESGEYAVLAAAVTAFTIGESGDFVTAAKWRAADLVDAGNWAERMSHILEQDCRLNGGYVAEHTMNAGFDDDKDRGAWATAGITCEIGPKPLEPEKEE